MKISRREVVFGLTGVCMSPAAVQAAASMASIELIALFDGSESMTSVRTDESGNSMTHAKRQRDGHIAAFQSPEVSRLLITQQIVVRAVLWSHGVHQMALLRIKTMDDIKKLCDAIKEQHPIDEKVVTGAGTYHELVLNAVINNSTRMGLRRIIDISTDEPVSSIEGQADCRIIREQARQNGDVIHALAIDETRDQVVVRSMQEHVVNGFVEVCDGWENYAEAIRKKLERELMMV